MHTREVARLASRLGRTAETTLAVGALLAVAALPVLEFALRWLFDAGIPGSAEFAQHLTLWIGFLGAAIAARQQGHLKIASGRLLAGSRLALPARIAVAVVSTAVAAGLCWAAWNFVRGEMDSIVTIQGWLPLWVVELVMPAALTAIAVRSALTAGSLPARVAAAGCAGAAAFLAFGTPLLAHALVGPSILVLAATALLGAPIFVVLGGSALLLFYDAGVPSGALAAEAYRLIQAPAVPTLALFTLAGYLLAEGGAGRRLVRLFRALFGWLPGGLAIVTVLICAFFTTFTGATGITILALGGLLLPILRQGGYTERFSIGLLTATGSIGLLFPPSLPAIIYGVVAQVSVIDVFVAGAVPGVLLVASAIVLGVREGWRMRATRIEFDACETVAAMRAAKWELGLPVIMLLGVFGGFATFLETAAVTLLYALVVEVLVHHEIDLRRDMGPMFVKSLALVGGVFMILAVSMGLTNYFVDAEIPVRLTEWTRAHIDSRILFLLALNLFLLAVGCVMDIFSATVVVVPLLLPVSRAFGIDPLHFGVVFLLNLELGYLTPPVGMNLFLASYRFERAPLSVCRDALPFIAAMAVVVLVVTYIPDLALALVRR